MCVRSAAATLPANPAAPALGLLGTAIPPAVTPLVRPPFFNPLLAAGAAGLGTSALVSPIVAPSVVAAAAVDAIGQPSEYLLLKNMFDPSTEVSSSLPFHVLYDTFHSNKRTICEAVTPVFILVLGTFLCSLIRTSTLTSRRTSKTSARSSVP